MKLSHVILLAVLTSTTCVAQNNGQGQGQGQGQIGGQFPGGIVINPDGVISSPAARTVNPALEQKRLRALAAQNLSSELVKASPLRMVSLVRLEAECDKRLTAGQILSAAQLYLAGLTQVQYLFVMPETNDLVLAGPAEGFAALADGRMVGIETGRPVLTLEDLLVMLRLKSTQQTLGCSFDPDAQRLANAQAWNRANSSPAVIDVARQRIPQMAAVLGNWNVTVFGIPATSHTAMTAVEADYQLKRLALGLDKPRIRGFLSHLDMARPGENTMRRWWFAPRYDVIERSPDKTAWRLAGPRLQLLAQEELVDIQGGRSDAPFTEVSSERFTRQFNTHIASLCAQVPSFASIQNVFDLSVVVAIIRRERLAESINWLPGLFLEESRLPLQQYQVAQEVPSLVNVKSVGRSLLIGLIGGGVTIVPDQVIGRSAELKSDQLPSIVAPADSSVWWWD